MNQFDQMRAAVKEARTTLYAADNANHQIARILVGRLRQCNHIQLAELKKELKQFNAHTGVWKS